MKIRDGICTRTGRFDMSGFVGYESKEVNRFIASESEKWLNMAWGESWSDLACVPVWFNGRDSLSGDPLRVVVELPFAKAGNASANAPRISFSISDLLMDQDDFTWGYAADKLRRTTKALRALADKMDAEINRHAPATPAASAPARAGRRDRAS